MTTVCSKCHDEMDEADGEVLVDGICPWCRTYPDGAQIPREPRWTVTINGDATPFPSLQDACENAAGLIDLLRGTDGMWHGDTSVQTSRLIHRALKDARADGATGDFVDCLAAAIERSAKPKNRGAKLLICDERLTVTLED